MLAARLVSQGVKRNPSRLVMASATAETSRAMSSVPNCRNDTTKTPPVTTTGPKYGIELNRPAPRAQMAACSQTETPERDPAREADEHAREDLHEQEPLDLQVDFVEDLDRDLLLASASVR